MSARAASGVGSCPVDTWAGGSSVSVVTAWPVASAHLPIDRGSPLTYCLALRLDEGLVFLSDTRTNAGVDNVGTYRKLHVLRPGDDRVFVLQSAGSLATTHEVLDRIAADLAAPGDLQDLASVTYLHE